MESYDLDVNSADIQWKLDGKTVQDSIGDDSYSFTAKAAGSSSTVSVTATPLNGTPATTSVTVTPATVDILWQATDSTVPPLYRGKAMPTSESTIRYVAMPELISGGAVLAPNTLVYSWKQNYNINQDASGYGKSSFTTPSSYLDGDGEHIDVEISSRDGSADTTASVDVSPIETKILWYIDDPVYGPRFGTALGDSYSVKGSDTAILAEPYFFSPGTAVSTDLAYAWQLNGNAANTTTSDPNVLVLHRDSGSTGDASINLSLSNATKLFQEATAALTLHLQ